MYTVNDVAKKIEEIAPPELGEAWDNNGIIVNCGNAVTGIMCALDVTPAVIDEAKAQGCNLIVTHHPPLFKALKQIKQTDIAFMLAANGMSAIAAHTNLDAANGGVNDALCNVLGFENAQDLATYGRMLTLNEEYSVKQLAQHCAKKLGAGVRFNDCGKKIKKLAVVCGSGGDFFEKAAQAGADCFLTGEASYHTVLEAANMNLSMVIAGHFATEYPVVPVLEQKLAEHFSQLKVFKSENEADPFEYVLEKE